MIFCQKFEYDLNCVCVLCKYSILLDNFILFHIVKYFWVTHTYVLQSFEVAYLCTEKLVSYTLFSHFPLYSSYSERGDSFRARTEHVFVQRFFSPI